jgi:transcriptional regulator with XRE-family HTH domain
MDNENQNDSGTPTGMADQVATDPTATLPAELVKARTKAGFTISDLHEKTKISRAVLLGYEKGRTRPGAREIRLLCEALQITPNKLIYGTEDPFEKNPLHEALGVDSDVTRLMKMLGLFQMLPRSEQDALLQLAAAIVSSRHGEAALKDLGAAFEVAGERMGDQVMEFADNLDKSMTEEDKAAMEKEFQAKRK